MKHYILQKTDEQLSVKDLTKWFLTISLLGPEDILSSGEMTNSNFSFGMDDEQYVYIADLNRNLTIKEAERIITGYLKVTTHDFEMESSGVYGDEKNSDDVWECEYIIDDEARKILTDNYCRQAHNEWIKYKMENDWRFGINLNIMEKTHPAMRPWDDLPDNFKKKFPLDDHKLIDYYSKNINKFS